MARAYNIVRPITAGTKGRLVINRYAYDNNNNNNNTGYTNIMSQRRSRNEVVEQLQRRINRLELEEKRRNDKLQLMEKQRELERVKQSIKKVRPTQ